MRLCAAAGSRFLLHRFPFPQDYRGCETHRRNIHATRPQDARRFYGDILGMEAVMDHGWIVTYASDSRAMPQVSIASEGGSGTPVPDLSIEVDNLDEVYRRIFALGLAIEYGPATEPWGASLFRARSLRTVD